MHDNRAWETRIHSHDRLRSVRDRLSLRMSLDEVDDLYRKHHGALLRTAQRMLKDSHDARDVLHEVFTALLARSPATREDDALVAWLEGATTYKCLNRIRARAAWRRVLAKEAVSIADNDAHERVEFRIFVREAIAHVPMELRSIAVSYYLSDMTQDEIAKTQGCSRRNIGYQLERIRRHVRDLAAEGTLD